jgi:hypothetical protein
MGSAKDSQRVGSGDVHCRNRVVGGGRGDHFLISLLLFVVSLAEPIIPAWRIKLLRFILISSFQVTIPLPLAARPLGFERLI